MVIIKLGFLLGLPTKPLQTASTSTTANEANKQRISSGKDKKLMSDKMKSKPTDKGSRITKEPAQKSEIVNDTGANANDKPTLPEHVYQVDKPKGFLHLEYILMPHLKPCQIDIVHWDIISKIYFENKTVVYRNVIVKDIIWIPIMVEHKTSKDLSIDELKSLNTYVINFIVTTDTSKICSEAKNETCELFYVRKKDIAKDCYVQAFETDPNIPIPKVKKSSKDKKTLRFSMDHPLSSVLHHLDQTLLHPRLSKLLQKLTKQEQINSKQYFPPSMELQSEFNSTMKSSWESSDDANKYIWPSKQEKKSQLSKQDKSIETNKKSKVNAEPKKKKEVCIKVAAESFFTDASLCTYRLTEKMEFIQDMFIVFSTFNLTSKGILTELNPLVIKLMSLKNLPVEHLIHENHVYLQYNIPNVARYITPPILLKELNGDKIQINENHIFFDMPMAEFTYFLKCNRLVVELVGIYSNENDLKPSIFGTEKFDFVKTPPRLQEHIYTKPKNIILAVACYDLSLMVQGIMDLKLMEPLRHPTNALSQTPLENNQNSNNTNETFPGIININQISFAFKKDHFPSPLTDGILFQEDTSLKIHVFLGRKITGVTISDDSIDQYNRFLIICYKSTVADSILSNVLYYNQQFVNSVLLPNYYMYNEYQKDIKAVDAENRTITGFWIDCGTTVLVFLEGSSTNYCLEIIREQIRVLNESLCRLYHNTSVLHYHRIYENFLAFGGIYKVTLRFSLKEMFAVMYTHMSKYVPKPAYEALKKLELMLEMQNSNIMNQHGIFPTVNELISFNIEFGVPHKCCNYS